jgi:hypothetical protein
MELSGGGGLGEVWAHARDTSNAISKVTAMLLVILFSKPRDP